MKRLQRVTFVMLVMALPALAGTTMASATTLEVGGITRNASVTVKASLEGSAMLMDTSRAFANTCTTSNIEGSSATYTGTSVSAPLSALTFATCTEEGIVVDSPGSLTVTNIAGTTNGTIRSIGARVTVPSPFGLLTCVTAASPGTDFGTLTGVISGRATIDLVAVINCGFFLPSAIWEARYNVTSPEGLGVTS